MANNSVETVEVDGSMYTYDHSTGVTKAKHANGYDETWSPCRYGYSLQSAFEAFLFLTNQFDRWHINRA